MPAPSWAAREATFPASRAGVPDRAPAKAGWVMSTPVSMTAMTFPSPFWVIWSACF